MGDDESLHEEATPSEVQSDWNAAQGKDRFHSRPGETTTLLLMIYLEAGKNRSLHTQADRRLKRVCSAGGG
jgi:hypothetical protein